ncbi:MAG: hypothetical protein V3V99_11230 [candidate division Zixibacteria bacterium]
MDSELLATQLKKHFGFSGVLRLQDLMNLAPRLGISSITPYAPASKERGAFGKLGQHIEILFKEDDWDGSQEHSIGHELREIIGKVASELDPNFVDAEGNELEDIADSFSAALFMDKESFYDDMISTGFDPITLRNHYHKSYIGIMGRMATILRFKTPREFIWVSVLESDSTAPAGYFRAKCFHRSPRYIPKVRYQIPNFLFPKRGQLVPILGNMKKAFESKRSVYIRKLNGLDFWNQYSLSVIIRPVIWAGKVAKLLVIALPESDAYKLRPQLISAKPLITDESFQVL